MLFPTFRSPVTACAVIIVLSAAVAHPIRTIAQQPSPAAATPAASASPAAPKDKGLNFSIPLPIGETTREIKIPERGPTGQAISQLMAVSAKRLDEDRVMMEKLVIDLYKPDGRSDYRIVLPTSVFNLKTRIISSDEPASITTPDFELSGEKMQFDTAARTGKFSGWVYMKIHNAKDLAAGSGNNAAKEKGKTTP